LDLLDRLVVQSLVELDDLGDEPRYRLHETVRQYAARRLDDAGETATTRDRHLDSYRDLLVSIWPTWDDVTLMSAAGCRRITPELDNVAVCLDHAADAGRWDDYAVIAVRAQSPLSQLLPDRARAMLERVADDSHVLAPSLRAEVVCMYGVSLVPLGLDPISQWQRAVELGADGIHPGVVTIMTQLLRTAMTSVSPADQVRLLLQQDAEEAGTGDPPVVVINRLLTRLFAHGAILGEVDLAERVHDQTQTPMFRDRFDGTDASVLVDLWSAVVALDGGALDKVDERCARVHQKVAARLPRGTRTGSNLTWHSAMARGIQGMADAYRGKANQETLRHELDAARMMRFGHGAECLGLALA
jgi:hypothetical protein